MENALPDLLETGFPGGQRVMAYTFTNDVYVTHPVSVPAKINQAQRLADLSFSPPSSFYSLLLLKSQCKHAEPCHERQRWWRRWWAALGWGVEGHIETKQDTLDIYIWF